MKINRDIKYLLVLCSLFFACERGNFNEVEEQIVNYVIENKIDANYILLLPETGCPGCISTAEYFLKDNSDNPELFTILTKIVSKKDFEIKTGIDLETNPYIFVDMAGTFSLNTENGIYPCLFIFDENKNVKEVQYQSPKNDFFEMLSSELNSD